MKSHKCVIKFKKSCRTKKFWCQECTKLGISLEISLYPPDKRAPDKCTSIPVRNKSKITCANDRSDTREMPEYSIKFNVPVSLSQEIQLT